MTSHMLAKELLNRPDGFLTATYDNKEYIITDFKRTKSHANIDDSIPYWTINLQDGGQK